MEFKEAYEAAKAGKHIRSNVNDSDWLMAGIEGRLICVESKINVNIDHVCYTWDTWQVKPEEIFVWGVSHGSCGYLGINRGQTIGIKEPYIEIEHNKFNFPTDKPQKFQLVPVEEDEN